MSESNQTTTPDALKHRRDADYAREVLGQLKASGMTDREIARRLGLSDRVLRQYKAGEQTMSYAVQFALESLLERARSPQGVHDVTATYSPATTWRRLVDDPLQSMDAGKIIAAIGKHGEYIMGTLATDGFGFFVETSDGTGAHRVPMQSIELYVVLPRP